MTWGNLRESQSRRERRERPGIRSTNVTGTFPREGEDFRQAPQDEMTVFSLFCKVGLFMFAQLFCTAAKPITDL